MSSRIPREDRTAEFFDSRTHPHAALWQWDEAGQGWHSTWLNTDADRALRLDWATLTAERGPLRRRRVGGPPPKKRPEPPAGSPDDDPVGDRTFTGPLIRGLVEQIDAVADDAHRTGSARPRHAAAVALVYTSCLVAWAEDHGLIDPYLRQPPPPGALPTIPGAAARTRLAYGCAALTVHPDTQCLLDPRYSPIGQLVPSERVAQGLLDWWATAPSLRYGDRSGPPSISGWLIGDLLQSLSAERVKGDALVQTPPFVADLIIDRTLLPAAAERPDTTLKAVDPSCGTGHFLIRLIDYLWELYTTGGLRGRQATTTTPVTGWTPVTPIEAVRRIVAGVDGCEFDPLTAAVARLRVVVAVGELLHRSGLLPVLRLDTIPRWVHPRIIVGDSLLIGVEPSMTAGEYAALLPQQAAIYNPFPTDLPAAEPTPPPAESDALFELTA